MKKSWLYNKTVLISGGASGIGGGLTRSLIVDYSCTVIAVIIDKNGLQETLDSLGDRQKNFSYLFYDVSKKENWIAIKQHLNSNGIKVDLIINNAGILPPFNRYENVTVELLEECMNVDFYSAAYSMLIMYDREKPSETPAFVTISSSAALAPIAGTAVYTAAKSASKGLTDCFSFEHPELYIAYVCPGFTKTNLFVRQAENMADNKLFARFMSSRDKMVKKIIKGISHKKRKMIFGADAKVMRFLYRVFPRSAPKLFRRLMRVSKQKIFQNLFL